MKKFVLGMVAKIRKNRHGWVNNDDNDYNNQQKNNDASNMNCMTKQK